MTKKYLNALAEDLRIERRRAVIGRSPSAAVVALEAFDAAVETVVIGLKRANPRVDRDRFVQAVRA